MSHIKNIEIKNFKSIRHAKIEDCRRVNVFIGYPNVGKSNILEALGSYSVLNNVSFRSRTLKDIVRFSRFIDIFHNGNIGEPSSINCDNNSLVYHLSNLDSLSLFIADGKIHQMASPNEFRTDGQTLLRWYIKQDGHSLMDSPLMEMSGKTMIKKYSFNPSVVFNSSSSVFLNIPYGENLNDIIAINQQLRIDFNSMLKEYNLNINLDKTEAGNKLELRRSLPDGTTMTLDWGLIADTLRRLFFYKAAMASNQNSVLLFEEPEAHMFPPYIAKFTTDVMYDKNNNQYFIATHSPFVLNDFMEDMEKEDLAIYAVGYLKGETTINRLTDTQVTDIYQYGVDLFFNLEEFLKDVVS